MFPVSLFFSGSHTEVACRAKIGHFLRKTFPRTKKAARIDPGGLFSEVMLTSGQR
jgi:hypothetical protein